jgi:hypothetical protein
VTQKLALDIRSFHLALLEECAGLQDEATQTPPSHARD